MPSQNGPMIDEAGNLNPMAHSQGKDEMVVWCDTCHNPITTRPYGSSIGNPEIQAAARWHRRHTGCVCLQQGVGRWEHRG